MLWRHERILVGPILHLSSSYTFVINIIIFFVLLIVAWSVQQCRAEYWRECCPWAASSSGSAWLDWCGHRCRRRHVHGCWAVAIFHPKSAAAGSQRTHSRRLRRRTIARRCGLLKLHQSGHRRQLHHMLRKPGWAGGSTTLWAYVPP